MHFLVAILSVAFIGASDPESGRQVSHVTLFTLFHRHHRDGLSETIDIKGIQGKSGLFLDVFFEIPHPDPERDGYMRLETVEAERAGLDLQMWLNDQVSNSDENYTVKLKSLNGSLEIRDKIYANTIYLRETGMVEFYTDTTRLSSNTPLELLRYHPYYGKMIAAVARIHNL